MADVVRSSAQGELNGKFGSPKQREAIVVRSTIHGTDELSKLVAHNIDPCFLELKDVEMRPVRGGVVISFTSKEATAPLQKELESNEAMRKAIENPSAIGVVLDPAASGTRGTNQQPTQIQVPQVLTGPVPTEKGGSGGRASEELDPGPEPGDRATVEYLDWATRKAATIAGIYDNEGRHGQ
ncbi:hypothetical protein MRX96_001818 [Rhipicephalus microplus]